MAGRACFREPEHELHTRYAWLDGEIWIDMDGFRAIRVHSRGWEIVDEPPILFRHFSQQKPLPEPVRGGAPQKLLDLLNFSDFHMQRLFLGYCVAVMVPDIPVCILIIHGRQGTGKSTILRLIKRLVDPCVNELHGEIRKMEDYALAAWKHWLLYFDNLSKIPAWFSDVMSRTSTGDGYETRTLYSNQDSTIFSYKRGIGIASINQLADKPDLLERSIIISPDTIGTDSRLDETEFWKKFESVKGEILGCLLDALSRAIRIRSMVKLERPPRMSDFAHWAAAGAMAMGIKLHEFQEALDMNSLMQNRAAIDSSVFTQTVIKMVEGAQSWSGSPDDLLEAITRIAEPMKTNTNAKSWPTNSVWAARRLNEIIPVLEAIGISANITRKASGRWIELARVSGRPESRNPSPEIPEVTNVHAINPRPTPNLGEVKALSYEGKTYGLDPSTWPEDLTYEYEEKAGMFEYGSQISREEAEKRAMDYIRHKYGVTDDSRNSSWRLAQ